MAIEDDFLSTNVPMYKWTRVKVIHPTLGTFIGDWEKRDRKEISNLRDAARGIAGGEVDYTYLKIGLEEAFISKQILLESIIIIDFNY